MTNNKVEQLFETARILLCDTEILEDYFSFQWKRYNTKADENYKHSNVTIHKDVYIFECFNDNDCIEFGKFYTNQIMKSDTFLYFWNASFDKSIISLMVNLVNQKENNIIYKLRKASDFIVNKKLNYNKIVSLHWKTMFDNNVPKNYKETEILDKLTPVEIEFYKQYKHLLVNKAEKKSINNKNTEIIKIINLPEFNIKSLCSGTNSGKEMPIGLKTLQLILFGEKQEFDFNNYSKIENISNDNMYEIWLSYCACDVISIERIFEMYAMPVITNRIYAIEECVKIKKINISNKSIFSHSNTSLINELFAIENKIDVGINFERLIPTECNELKAFIKHVNENKTLDNTTIKTKFKDTTHFDLNGCNVDISLGGIHGVVNNYINNENNLWDLDFTSLYPNLILMFESLFKNIMDTKLYRQVLNLRIDYKKKSKDIQFSEAERREFNLIQEGLKLLANSTYGLINMDDKQYGKSISHRNLGRLICLYGHKLAIDMCLHNKEMKPKNINTDGIFFEVPKHINIDEICNELTILLDINVEATKFKSMIQKDVNNYIAINGYGKVVTKGCYNVTFKNQINSLANVISNNMTNAINLIGDKNHKPEITPLYFKKDVAVGLCDDKYYFTDKENGIPLIKNLEKPTNYLIDNDQVYVTNDINHAKLELYEKYAKITLNRIMNFDISLETSKSYTHEIKEDTIENNNNKRINIKLLKNTLDIDIKNIGYSGYSGNIKSNVYSNGVAIKPLINYGKTELLNSTETRALHINNNGHFVIIDVDIHNKDFLNVENEFVNKLKEIPTFKTWNSVTEKTNFKLIFRNDLGVNYKVNDKYSKYIETLQNAIVWSIDNDERVYYNNNIKPLNISDFEDMVSSLLIEKTTTDIKLDEYKHNDEINKIVLDLLEKTQVFGEILNEDRYSLKISCPFCKNKTDFYDTNKEVESGYANVNIKNGLYTLQIHQHSNTCKTDQKHIKYFKILSKQFKNKMIQINKEAKKLQLIKDLKQFCDIKFDGKFFILNTVVIAGTGLGKTFNTACKIVYNVLRTGKFTLTSTKENTNVEDIYKEVIKVIKLSLTGTTQLIDEFFDFEIIEEIDLSVLGIYKMTAINRINEEKLKEYRVIITNHKFFFNNGHLAIKNRSMELIHQQFNNKNMEIIMDEFESHYDKGLIHIALNSWTAYKLDIDTKSKDYRQTNNFVYKSFETKENENNVFEFAKINNKMYIDELANGINEYKLNPNGNKNVMEELNNNTKTNKVYIEDRSRPIVYSTTGDQFKCFKVLDKLTYLTKINTKESTNFEKLLQMSKQEVIHENIIEIGELIKPEEAGEPSTFVSCEIIDTVEELKEWILTELKDKTNEEEKEEFKLEMVEIKRLMSTYGSHLFNKTLILHIESKLDEFNCDKYFTSANNVGYDLEVNEDMKYLGNDKLKELEFIVIDRDQRIDDTIIELVKRLDTKLHPLIFLGAKKKFDDLLNSKKVLLPNTLLITATDGQRTNSHSNVVDPNNYDRKIQNMMSHIHGTESQGKNYSKSELMILNSNFPIHITDRLIVRKGKIHLKTYGEVWRDKMIQTIGRILRGDFEYKAVLIFLPITVERKKININYIEEFELLVDFYNKFNFSIKVGQLQKDIQGQKKHLQQKYFEKIIDYVESKADNLNRNENKEVIDYNQDERANNKDIDSEAIIKFYKNVIDVHYIANKKKLKDTQIIGVICEKFGISERTFKKLKKQYI